MSRLRVVPVVEGHGEQQSAIRTLLVRLWTELLDGEYINVLQPIRIPRSKLVQPSELLRAVDLALLKLDFHPSDDPSFVLVLFDADDDCPARLASALRQTLQEERSHVDVAVVIANIEFETWFVAAAESLRSHFSNFTGSGVHDPEAARQGKGLVEKWMSGRYGETVDQPRLTAAMDLALCRRNSPSFDKLCRELERRKNASPD
jgi:hypothetical protein